MRRTRRAAPVHSRHHTRSGGLFTRRGSPGRNGEHTCVTHLVPSVVVKTSAGPQLYDLPAPKEASTDVEKKTKQRIPPPRAPSFAELVFGNHWCGRRRGHRVFGNVGVRRWCTVGVDVSTWRVRLSCSFTHVRALAHQKRTERMRSRCTTYRSPSTPVIFTPHCTELRHVSPTAWRAQ
eukprot:gene14490-biopygen2084